MTISFASLVARPQYSPFYGKEGEPLIEVNTSSGTGFEEDLGHGERMRKVIDEGLSALQEERVPETNILDAVRILEIQDAVYDHARTNPFTNGPYPMGGRQPDHRTVNYCYIPSTSGDAKSLGG